MENNKAIETLKENIKKIYKKTQKQIDENIYRGHSRCISVDVEDEIAKYILQLLPKRYKLFLDPSISINEKLYLPKKKKIYRPDLLVINENAEVTAFIELKAIMGYCRDATDVINKMVEYDKDFKKEKKLKCTFPDESKDS